jgi:hypothetical protein
MENQESHSHAKLAASIVLLVVIGASLVGAQYLRTNSASPRTSTSASASQSTTTSPTPCAQAYPSQITNRTTLSNGTEITDVAFPALVMSPNSSMALCVSYGGSSYSGSVYNSINAWESNGQMQPTQNVNINALPASVSIANGQRAVVEYTVAAGQDSVGFYGLSLLQMCIPVPLAVGYGTSQVNSTDFPGLFGVRFGCPAISLDAQIVGYTGASITYLETESSFNPTINITGVSVSAFPTSQGAENVTFRMSLQSFSHPLTAGLSLNESIVRAFDANPDLTTLPANDSCSWYPNNQAAANDMTTTTFQKLPSNFMQVDAPAIQLGTYSNATYSFSMLISGPIASFTAIDPTLYAEVSGSQQGLYAIAAYFPVSISGQLQTISGPCQNNEIG